MSKSLALLSIVVVLMIGASAQACPVGVGGIIVSHSWTQGGWDDIGNPTAVDHIQMRIDPAMDAGAFELPDGMLSLLPGWSQTFNDGQVAIFDGPASFDIPLLLTFTDATPQDDVNFHVFYTGYLGGEKVPGDDGYMSSLGANPQFSSDQVSGDVYSVPEPATMSLLIAGGLALLRRRKH